MYLEFGAVQEETTFKEIKEGKCFLVQNDPETLYMKLKLSEDEAKLISYNAINLIEGTVKRITDGTKVFSSDLTMTIQL